MTICIDFEIAIRLQKHLSDIVFGLHKSLKSWGWDRLEQSYGTDLRQVPLPFRAMIWLL